MPYKTKEKQLLAVKQWWSKHPSYWREWYSKNKKSVYQRNKKKGYLCGLGFWREKIRERDNHSCQKCGKLWIKGERRLDVHKKELDDSYKYNQQVDPSSWVTLCHKCHIRLHFEIKKLLK